MHFDGLRSLGRGAGFTPLRGVVERVLHHTYRGGWPAYAWAKTGRADRVVRVDIALEMGLRQPLTIAFASDLHLGPTTSTSTLERAFTMISDARPDVLALGGDYVFLDATEQKARALRSLVASVPARVKVAVLGNHDLWTQHALIEDALRDAGATVLINDAIRLPPPHDEVALIGIDDPWTGQPDIERALRAASDARVKLAICHEPEGLPLIAGYGISLLLAGHTHGGQIALPGPRPIVIPGHIGKLYPFGHHSVDGVELVVSRGVGATELPVRAFAPPDIVIVTIT